MIPIGTAYIQTIYTFRSLLYCMGGMLLITNMDNFIAELFKLELEKNHNEILSQK